jgi:hypothetical protein
MWDDQRNAKSDYNSKNVKKCLSDKFIQNWNNNVMNSAKCLNYKPLLKLIQYRIQSI